MHNKRLSQGACVALGAGIGAAIGSAIGNVAVGIAVGDRHRCCHRSQVAGR